MFRRIAFMLPLVLAVASAPAISSAAPEPTFHPGARGVGDRYFPLDGNGGYDVQHYTLNIRYDPANRLLRGAATIQARATQNLSRFNFDLDGLTVRSVTVGGRAATWRRDSGELVITPASGLPEGSMFTTVVRYDGSPRTFPDLGGWMATDDGAVVAGQPHVASAWFPVNDHPSDKASYSFLITVPAGVEAVANGVLSGHRTRNNWTTWHWEAVAPMASYLATATIGQFDLHKYQRDGVLFLDAIDPDLLTRFRPHSGRGFAIARVTDFAYKRLTHRVQVPAVGGRISFWVNRDIETGWDHTFVEARTAGRNDWTTLPDLNGHTSRDTGFYCAGDAHSFLRHYQTRKADGSCRPRGTTGEWWAASGTSGGWERWVLDLSRYAGSTAEVSISYTTDPVISLPGVFVDDVVVSTGEGSTGFEPDSSPLDGWRAGSPVTGEPAPRRNWISGTAGDAPPPLGQIARRSLARQPEILRFLSDTFGAYPFNASGAIIDDLRGVGFALENQTRPIYAPEFFATQASGDSVVVHELAHQWYGDSLAVASWQHIWLNEGFATYAEWLWSEREGNGTPQQIFDSIYNGVPASDPFWQLRIGDPGSQHLFDGAVYYRGAMTLQALRNAVGDHAFFTILRRWAQTRAGGNVTTPQFIRLAERISGRDLTDLFQTWLFTRGKPTVGATAAPLASAQTTTRPVLINPGAASARLLPMRR